MPPPYTLDPDYRAPVAYTKYNDPPPSGRELSSRAGDVQRDGGDLPSESVRDDLPSPRRWPNCFRAPTVPAGGAGRGDTNRLLAR